MQKQCSKNIISKHEVLLLYNCLLWDNLFCMSEIRPLLQGGVAMRRIICLILVSIVAFPLLAAEIDSDGSLPPDVFSEFSVVADKETKGRKDISLMAGNYSERILSDNSIEASFLLSFSDKQILVEFFGEDREALLSSLAEVIHGILFYDESLYSDSETTLGYIIDGSYSFLSDQKFREGTRLRAVDSLGVTRGVFEVSANYDGAVSLDPVFIREPFPGMRLENAGEWKFTITASMGFDFSSLEAFGMINIGRSDLIYPFVPILSFAYSYSSGKSRYYGGIGLEAYLNLSRIFPSVSFTLIQEGRIGGSASVLIGGGADGFDWSSVFSIFYEHRMLPSFYWRAGYQNLLGSNMLVIGFGGDF